MSKDKFTQEEIDHVDAFIKACNDEGTYPTKEDIAEYLTGQNCTMNDERLSDLLGGGHVDAIRQPITGQTFYRYMSPEEWGIRVGLYDGDGELTVRPKEREDRDVP